MSNQTTVRPFRVEVREEVLVELRRRIQASRWPEQETVADPSQGVQLATMQALVRYWASDYEFGRVEARLNAFPQFLTEIDGLDIHFLHLRSPHPDALPLIITHGWPGSVIEMLNVIGPSATPPHMAATPPTRSMWWSRPCPATASPPNRPPPAGTRSTSPVPGSR